MCGFVGALLAPRRFRFWRAVWACVLGPGLGCAQPFLAGLSGCVFCAFFFFCFSFFFSGSCGPCPSIPFLSGWAGGSPFFFFPFRCPFSPWAAVTGLVLPVSGGWSPCASSGVLSSVPSGGGFGRLWWCWRAVWRLWAVFVPFPPPPSFFLGGGGACLFLPLPSLGWRTHWPAFTVVFRAVVFSCVLCGRVPAPSVGWAIEAVPRTPWLGYGIQPVSGPLTPCTEGKTPVDAPFREPMHRQQRFVYQNIRNQQGFIFILFPSIFMLPF